VIAGLVAVAFQWTLFGANRLRDLAAEEMAARDLPGWLIFAVIGGVLGVGAGYVTRFAPEAAGSGIPHVKAVLLHLRPMRWLRLLTVKFVGGAMALGAGFSLGREGPTVQMGASIGKGLSELFKVPRSNEAQLVAGGAGAGLAAAFNAPLAGFVFVIEELQRELSPLTFSTALISTVSATVVSRALTGDIPSFGNLPAYEALPLHLLPIAIALGLVAALLGLLFNRGLLLTIEKAGQIKKLTSITKPLLVGLGVGVIAWYMPSAVGGGHQVAEQVLGGEFAGARLLPFLLALLLVKLVLTWVSYSTGVPGGIFAPMLLLGALSGLLIGEFSAFVLPESVLSPALDSDSFIPMGTFAVLGMAALFSASVRAPLTGVVLIMEMTGNYDQLLPLMVCCFTAALASEQLGGRPIYESLLELQVRRETTDAEPGGEPVMIDLVVEPGSDLEGRSLKASGMPKGCLIVTVKRGGQEIVPSGTTELLHGDELVIVISGAATRRIHQVEAMSRSRH
jgi:CIC family chloride channel protein